jgi:hypothetical protein
MDGMFTLRRQRQPALYGRHGFSLRDGGIGWRGMRRCNAAVYHRDAFVRRKLVRARCGRPAAADSEFCAQHTWMVMMRKAVERFECC